MNVWFKLCSMIVACVMMAFSGIGCADFYHQEQPEASDTIENPDRNSQTTDSSDEEKESMMQDIWESIHIKALTKVGIKVLFIGDSLTFYNDMPSIFEAFSRAAGKRIRVDSFTKSGMGIAMMRDDATLWAKISDKIASQNWDIIVFQPQRNQTVMTEFFPRYPWKEYSAAKDLVRLIQNAGAVPILYSTFGVTKGSVTKDGFTKTMTREEHTNLITAYNATVSELLDCKAVYVGETFQAAYEKNSSINLYHEDQTHPCEAGSYLIAVDFYTVIFGESAEKVNYSGGLDAEMASFLREQSTLLLQFAPTQKAEVKE